MVFALQGHEVLVHDGEEQLARLGTDSLTTQCDIVSRFLHGFRGVKRQFHCIARTGIHSCQWINEHKHGVWHMEIERERTVFLEFDGDGFLLSHNVVTHDDIDVVVQLLQLRRVIHYHISLDDHFAAMHAVFAPIGTGIIQQLRHILLLLLLLRLHAERK